MAPLRVALTLALAAVGLVAADPVTETCGGADFLPTEYVCYNNKTLCPIINSLPLSHCAGTGGCYAPQQFSCGEDGVLRTLPKTTKPFTLTAWGSRSAYRGQEVRACGNYLAIGANARVCTACPKNSGVECAKYGGKTVLWPDGKMVSSPLRDPKGNELGDDADIDVLRPPTSLVTNTGTSTPRTAS